MMELPQCPESIPSLMMRSVMSLKQLVSSLWLGLLIFWCVMFASDWVTMPGLKTVLSVLAPVVAVFMFCAIIGWVSQAGQAYHRSLWRRSAVLLLLCVLWIALLLLLLFGAYWLIHELVIHHGLSAQTAAMLMSVVPGGVFFVVIIRTFCAIVPVCEGQCSLLQSLTYATALCVRFDDYLRIFFAYCLVLFAAYLLYPVTGHALYLQAHHLKWLNDLLVIFTVFPWVGVYVKLMVHDRVLRQRLSLAD